MENSLKVLISDDCVDFSTEVLDKFRAYSIDLSFLPKDGFKIIELIESVHPDVVIMDLFMPRIDAIGIITSIKNSNAEKTPIFMVVSNFKRESLEREVLSAGASYFLLKPITHMDIINRITRIISVSNYHVNRNSDLNVVNAKACSDIEVKVTDILHQIGVPAHIKGYHYLRSSIMMSVENPEIINAVTKKLYPSVARKYNTTSSTNKRMPLNGYNSEKNKGDTINFRQGKKNKKKEKNKLKCSDIYLACENISKIKSIGTMKTLRRNQNQNYFQFNEFDDKDSVLKKSLNNIARGIKDICSNSNEIIGYEEINLKGSGIKKIIVSNTHKPSNFTNQLLISGKKCINEFKELNQEEVKRKINNYPL